MKIGIFSDIHLEKSKWKLRKDPDVAFYINAGDTSENREERLSTFSEWGNDVLSVYGNHDYYDDFGFDEPRGPWLVEYNGLLVAGATLWTNLEAHPLGYQIFMKKMLDYDRMRIPKSQLDMLLWHEHEREFLFGSEADIIVSHHLPSFKSVHRNYTGNLLNYCFATEFGWRISSMRKPPKLWIHGHTHHHFDYKIGKTRIICHPRGYPRRDWNYFKYQPKIVDL